MGEWQFSDFASKGNLLRTVREQSDAMLDLASDPGRWEDPTASGHWQVRDVIGHLVDTTEGYFEGIDVAQSGRAAAEPLGVRDMNKHVDEGARALRDVAQADLLARLDKDRAEMMAFFEGIDEEQWGAFLIPHKYLGPLPAFFYPVAQLVDYAVHTWDIREGRRISHALDGDAADLLVPFCFIVWQSTADCTGVEPYSLGVRITTGGNAGDTVVDVSPDGVVLEPGDVGDQPVVLEFDAASFVLTAMGRCNGGTARGDGAIADRFCNLFFRI
jgi:uncharacterized protein (TIGR03083 family)